MKVFDFNIDLCVACHACMTACYLENGFELPWRNIYSESKILYPGLPVHNISIACNHCADAPCMQGCPSRAYYRDKETGAVILDHKKCLGCNYCYWNCPYDAPRYNQDKGQVEKCTLCADRLIDGYDPACVSACPTGALAYKDAGDDFKGGMMFDSSIEPRLNIHSSGILENKPEIIPEPYNPTDQITQVSTSKISVLREWSLIVFTYISSLLFAFNISNFFGNIILPRAIYLALIAVIVLLPLLHLGKAFRSWRALAGVFRSALSTEIFFLLLFAGTSALASFLDLRSVWIISFISGVILLIAIDNVYTFSDPGIRYHSSQSFISGLLLASFLLGDILPFVFISFVKVCLWLFYNRNRLSNKWQVAYLICHITLYTFCAISFCGTREVYILMFILLLASELFNRILYYLSFSPPSYIKKFFNDKLLKYEKVRNTK